MKKSEKHAGGRPIELKSPVKKQYRVDATTQKAFAVLMKKWDCDESAAMRRAVREAAGIQA